MNTRTRPEARMYIGESVYLPRHAAAVEAPVTRTADHVAKVVNQSKARQAKDIEWLRTHTPMRLLAVAAAHLAPVVAVLTAVAVF